MRWPLPLALASALAAAAAPAAEQLGRLFTTPAERAELDRLRAEATAPAAVAEAPDTPPPPAAPAPAPAPLRVDGLVLPRGRPPVVWVNGRLQPAGSGGVEVDRARQRVRLRRDPQAPVVELAPGQRYDPVTGRVGDVAAP